MGLRGRLTDWLIGKLIEKSADIGGWNITRWQDKKAYQPDFSNKALVKKYASWVYACANKNAISCAQVPLRLYTAKPVRKTKALFPTKHIEGKRKKYLAGSPTSWRYCSKASDVEEVVEHPFLDLMTNVNEFNNQFDILELLFLFQELTGNAYWYIDRDNQFDVPSEIWPLYSQYIRIVVDKQKFIGRYEFVVSEEEVHVIDPRDMVHFKLPNPQDPFFGMGPLQAAVLAADLSEGMNTYETSLLQNDARPDMALVLPPTAGIPRADDIERQRKEWYRRFRGVKNKGNLAILSGGAELKEISITPKEMAFLEGRKATLNEIAAIFGVPLSKLTTESVNRANAEAGDYSYMKDTVLPRLRKVEQKINEKLLPMFDDRLFCAFDNPVPEDKEFRLKEVESHLKTGYSSPNEEREKDGLEEVKWGNEPLVPMNIRPLSTELPTPQPFNQGPPKPPKKGVKSPRTLPPLNHPTNFINEPFVGAMKEYYESVLETVLTGFDRDMKSAKSPADDYMSAWFDMQEWNKELWLKSEPFIRYTMVAGGEKALKQVALDARVFEPINPGVTKALSEHRYGMVNGVNSTIVKNLREKLAAGMEASESLRDLRDRVQEVFVGLGNYGAERIARTETIWAWNEGAKQGYKQSGVVEKLQWVSSGDQRSCDFCLDMDGAIIGIDNSFFDKGDSYEVNDRELDFEYEKIDHPPLHPNCRCCIVPVI